MWPNHPTSGTNFPPLPLFEGDRIIQYMPDQKQLTTWYTEHAVKFIEKNKERPFFLYVPHTMPHVPLHVSDKHKGKSGHGLYADVIMEIDWSVGEILAALRRNGLDGNTLVVFSSDNGPWLEYGDHAGNALPLREGKMTSFEGGLRVPFLARWPGHVPAGRTCREVVAAMDFFPTFGTLAGAQLPADRIIDGRDIWPLLSGQRGAKSPHEAFFYYWEERLESVRSGKWKLHLGHEYIHPDPPGAGGKPGTIVNWQIGVELFDLENDVGEKTDLAKMNPDVVQRLQALAEQCRDDLGDSAQKRIGKNVRPPGRLPIQQAADGTVLLHARDASIHGSTVRYEPQTNKNTIGYWTKLEDWVSWDFSIDQLGTFEVEILQGCGKGSGGSEVEFSVDAQTLKIVVQDTGGFQNFVSRGIGRFKFDHAGRYSLSVKPTSKPGVAVMDLRSVTLRRAR
jgi:hypothetical protein